MTSPVRRIVVTGATGKQGGALISALLAEPSQPFEIYAVTRDKTSKSAQSLAKKPNVYLLQGNFKDPSALFKQVKQPWGLFSVTNPMNAKTEEQQGKAVTAAAISAGVRHIVFTATDRGANSDESPTPVPHFASKFNIEKDIITQSKESGGTWTFLRPVAFYENMTNDYLGKGFVSMWRLNEPNSKLKLVSTKDIGKVAAQAFLKADKDEYRNKAIPLVGDEISVQEANEIFKQSVGQEMPETYAFFGRFLKWVLHEQLGIMFDWFKSNGFEADVKNTRAKYPFMKDFRSWLETESAWKKA